MAFWAAIGWAFNARLASMLARAIAPTGAMFTFLALVDRRALGQADLGHLVGLGRAPDLGADPAASSTSAIIALVSAIDDPRRADRRRRAAGHRRRRQRADHLLLGELVEHAAPGRERSASPPRPRWRSTMLLRDAADDARASGPTRSRSIFMRATGDRRWSASIDAGVGERRRRPRRVPDRSDRRELEQRRANSSPWAATRLYVWGAYARDRCVHGGRAGARAQRHRRARAALAPPRRRAMKPRHKRAGDRRRASSAAVGAAVGAGARTRSRATSCSSTRRRRSRRTRRRAARTFALGGLVEEGIAQARRHRGELRRHRHRAVDPGALRGHPSRPVQGRQGRGRPGPARRTACSSPARCSPSTTRTTCRPKPPRR